MKAQFKSMMKDERGITALETAIILIAFVVVAAIFAFTVLSTGTFLTERSKEAAYSGLQEVTGSMELKGSVVLETSGTYVTFNLAPVAGGSSVDLSTVRMTYRDSGVNQELTWASSAALPTAGNWYSMNAAGTTGLQILSSNTMAKIRVAPATAITHDWTFTLEIRPPTGTVLNIQRTTPAQIDVVTDLH